jgi:hypothetical protein
VSSIAPADLEALLAALLEARTNFIVVGGVAAVLHGAPSTTFDLDIVPAQDAENVSRLLGVLSGLEARHRDLTGRVLPVEERDLTGIGQRQLTTRLGPLDVLCRLHDGRGYTELLDHTVLMADDGLEVRVLDLETLIQIKSSTGRAKDRLMLALLLAIRDEDA